MCNTSTVAFGNSQKPVGAESAEVSLEKVNIVPSARLR